MGGINAKLLPLVQQARGRCHSCANQRTFNLPVSGPVYYCRALGCEYDQTTRDDVRNCPHWLPFHPPESEGRMWRSLQNPLIAQIIEAEDQMFWQLKVHLDRIGVDLKSLLIFAQPPLVTAEELDWVDGLDDRFGNGELEPVIPSLEEIIEQLRALRYNRVCRVLDHLVTKLNLADHYAIKS